MRTRDGAGTESPIGTERDHEVSSLGTRRCRTGGPGRPYLMSADVDNVECSASVNIHNVGRECATTVTDAGPTGGETNAGPTGGGNDGADPQSSATRLVIHDGPALSDAGSASLPHGRVPASSHAGPTQSERRPTQPLPSTGTVLVALAVLVAAHLFGIFDRDTLTLLLLLCVWSSVCPPLVHAVLVAGYYFGTLDRGTLVVLMCIWASVGTPAITAHGGTNAGPTWRGIDGTGHPSPVACHFIHNGPALPDGTVSHASLLVDGGLVANGNSPTVADGGLVAGGDSSRAAWSHTMLADRSSAAQRGVSSSRGGAVHGDDRPRTAGRLRGPRSSVSDGDMARIVMSGGTMSHSTMVDGSASQAVLGNMTLNGARALSADAMLGDAGIVSHASVLGLVFSLADGLDGAHNGGCSHSTAFIMPVAAGVDAAQPDATRDTLGGETAPGTALLDDGGELGLVRGDNCEGLADASTLAVGHSRSFGTPGVEAASAARAALTDSRFEACRLAAASGDDCPPALLSPKGQPAACLPITLESDVSSLIMLHACSHAGPRISCSRNACSPNSAPKRVSVTYPALSHRRLPGTVRVYGGVLRGMTARRQRDACCRFP